MSIKRVMDVAGAAVGLTLLSPVLLLAAIAIKYEGGPVIFQQERIGRYAKPFNLLKFRTMRPAIKVKSPSITIGNDARITTVGQYLRRTKLDEAPQLINVLRGEMSFVGPRPEIGIYIDLTNPVHREVLDSRPGLTDPASLRFWNEAGLLAAMDEPETFYRLRLLPLKHLISLEYARRATVWSDASILAATLIRVTRSMRNEQAAQIEMAKCAPREESHYDLTDGIVERHQP